MRTMLFTALVMAVLASSGASYAGGDLSAQANKNQPAKAGTAQSTGTTPAPTAQPIVSTAVVSDINTDKYADMIICHETQAATGSRLGESRECHAKREWDKRRKENQLNVSKQQRDALSVGAPPGATGRPAVVIKGR